MLTFAYTSVSQIKLVNLSLNSGAEAPSISNTGGDRNNTGSRNDESDVLKVLNHVKINTTLQGPLSMIRGILGDFKEKALSFSKEELKLVEEKLKIAFTEFYQKLRLLKSYR